MSFRHLLPWLGREGWCEGPGKGWSGVEVGRFGVTAHVRQYTPWLSGEVAPIWGLLLHYYFALY